MSEATTEEVKEEATTESSAADNLSGAAKTVLETIEKLTVLELADLVKAIEDKFGVVAAAPMAVGVMPAAAGAAGDAGDAGDDGTVDVVLTSAGDKKIQVLKVVREITGLGLKEAKDLVDSAPKAVKEGVEKEEAEGIKKQLEEQGASVELK